MSKKNLTKKEISDTFKKFKEKESEALKYSNFLREKGNDNFSLEQNDVWIVSDSSTSFANFNPKNHA